MKIQKLALDHGPFIKKTFLIGLGDYFIEEKYRKIDLRTMICKLTAHTILPDITNHTSDREYVQVLLFVESPLLLPSVTRGIPKH